MAGIFKRKMLSFCAVVAIALLVCARPAYSEGEPLAGQTGYSEQWGSGWLDLAPATNFEKGTVLRLKIGGTAKKILVRLLSKGHLPSVSDGIIGDAMTVPENRIVEVKLDFPVKEVIQISVHGGPNPWGEHPLGGANGPATLEAAWLSLGGEVNA